MQRIRQFGDLRSSRESKRGSLNESSLSHKVIQTPKKQFDRSSQASSTQSFYRCVNCQNLNMSAEKVRQNRQRDELERSRYQDLQKSRRVFDEHMRQSQEQKYGQEKQKILDENKHMIQVHNLAKQQQRQTIEHQQQMQQQRQRQNRQLLEQQMVERQKRASQLRGSLQKQINDKNQKLLRQQMEDRYQQPVDNSQSERLLALSRRRADEYKEGLLQQIRDNQEKKRLGKCRQTEHEKTAFALLQLAEQRARQMLLSDKKRKAQYQDQLRDLARSTQKKKTAAKAQREQEHMESIISQQNEQKQYLENERARVDRLNKYKSEIQKQIDDKKKGRLSDKLQEKYSTAYMNLSYQQIQKRLCDSCDRIYPKNYMTRYKKKKT